MTGIDLLWLLAIAPISFIQNMAFTLVSRSRNGNDPTYHRWCAWASNGVWFLCYTLIMKNIWDPIMRGEFLHVFLAMVIYTVATAEGSVVMMKRLIKKEKGKRRVGAVMEDQIKAVEARVKDLERFHQSGRFHRD